MLRENLDDLPLAEEVKDDLEEQLQLAEVALNARQPNRNVLREVGSSVRKILESITANLAAKGILELFSRWGA
jgi:hypothetical protein